MKLTIDPPAPEPAKLGFFQEGWQRLKLASPPYIVKWQKILAGIGSLGAGLALYTWPGRLAYIGTLASYLTAFSGGAILFMSFAVKTLGIILPAGTSISNPTEQPIEITPAAPVSDTTASLPEGSQP